MILALGSRPAAATGQVEVHLTGRRVIFPTPDVDAGYISTPIRPFASSGVIAWDGMDRQLYLLSGAGGAVRRIGRNGEGPGEYRNAGLIWTRGDSIVLTDAGIRRATIFDARDGRVVDSWRVGLETRWNGFAIRPLVAFGRNCWLGTSTRPLPRRAGLEYPETIEVLVLVNGVGQRERYDSIAVRYNAQLNIRPLGEMGANRIASVTATPPHLAIAPDGRGVAFVEASESSIIIHHNTDPCKGQATRIVVPAESRVLTRTEVADNYRVRMRNRPRTGVTLEEAVADAVEQTRRVNGRFLAPLFSAAFLDTSGAIWIELVGDANVGDYGKPRRWIRVSGDQATRTTIIAPRDVRLQSADGKRVLGWHTSDRGGSVVEFELSGP